MEFTYESLGTNTYLVYTIRKDDAVDSMSLGMLTNNKITGLAQTLFMQRDEERFIKYNVTSKITVRQFFTGPVNKKRLIGVLSGIADGLLSAEDYMIDTGSILLDPDYIFADVSTCGAILICLPIGSETHRHDLGAFFKDIMANIQFDSTESLDHVAKIFNFLNGSPVFSLADFKRLLDEIKGLKRYAKTPPVQPKAPPAGIFPAQKPAAAPKTQPKPVHTAVQIPQSAPVQKTGAAPQGKRMSLFNLLTHYSKENKTIYQQQKAAKKAQQTPGKAKTKTSHPPKPVSPPAENAQSMERGFAVPGENVQSGARQKVSSTFYEQPKANASAQPVPQPSIQYIYRSSAPAAPDTDRQACNPPVQQGHKMNFGETSVLGGGTIGETTVLSAGAQQARNLIPYLIRGKNNEKIPVNKPVFRIGKERSYVDYFIGDNTAVSRSHANIISRDGRYFAVDTNSTNHTYVNGKMIQSNVETEIAHGDKLRLGNEDFEFKLY